DGNAKSAQHVWQVIGFGVDAQSWFGDATKAGDGALTLWTEFQFQYEVFTYACVDFFPVLDVAFVFEAFGDAGLQFRRRHAHGVVMRRVSVAQTSQHVCDRIGHTHMWPSPFLVVVS